MKNLFSKNSLIVSCQALEDEPLYGSEIMAKMAQAAFMGGAKGIRANTKKDIQAIKKVVDLPIIGIVKKDYEGYDIYITPTIKEVQEVYDAGAEIVAIDATNRQRPNGITLAQFVKNIKTQFPNLLIMADVATFEEGFNAYKLGVDIISTTLCGYTAETINTPIPNFDLVSKLSENIDIPIVCEGGVQTPEQLSKALSSGAYACVIGSAITRPRLITKRFSDVITNEIN